MRNWHTWIKSSSGLQAIELFDIRQKWTSHLIVVYPSGLVTMSLVPSLFLNSEKLVLTEIHSSKFEPSAKCQGHCWFLSRSTTQRCIAEKHSNSISANCGNHCQTAEPIKWIQASSSAPIVHRNKPTLSSRSHNQPQHRFLVTLWKKNTSPPPLWDRWELKVPCQDMSTTLACGMRLAMTAAVSR